MEMKQLSYYEKNKDKIKAKYNDAKMNKEPRKYKRDKNKELSEEDKPICLKIQEYNKLVTIFYKMQDLKLNTDEIERKIDLQKSILDANI